ncbi:hypothetical protein ACFQ46_09685 [Kineococcus sp. GCM10028916]|uniref:hypothetical protein n=1 Tax=Kineococcus sp. GCM10028916 TaxID=3273394 RepID=UPI0036292A16
MSPAFAAPTTPEDAAEFLERLAVSLSRVLGPAAAGTLVVQRHRSLGDRVAGRAGAVRSLRLTLPSALLSVQVGGPGLTATAQRVVRGVTIARRDVPVGEFLELLAAGVADLAASTAGGSAAAARALAALGLAPAADALLVDPADVTGSLRSLPARARGLVPDAALPLVQALVDRLLDTVPRVAGGGVDPARLAVRSAAVDYLPDTLRAFAVLPREWARSHVLPGAGTAEQLLLDQLGVLLEAVTRLHDAAVLEDASGLVVNGLFLTDRFAGSSLDLPD